MAIIIAVGFYVLGMLVGLAVILIPHYRKKLGHKNKYFSSEEILTVNRFKNGKFASSNEEYNYQKPYIKE